MYATPADAVALYGKGHIKTLTDGGNLKRALEDASGLCDTYIGGRYPLPLTEIPISLRNACIDIALYRIAFTGGTWTEDGRKRYEDALKWLKDIAKGDANLLPLKKTHDPENSGIILTEGPSRLFGRDGLRDW